MKILYNAVDSEATGSQRILNPLRELAARGLVEIQPLNSNELGPQRRWADILVMQCLIGPQHFGLISILKKQKIPIILDYDDNFAELPEALLKRLQLTRQEAVDNWKKYLSLADVITTTCPYLADIILKNLSSTTDTRVVVLPNYLTTEEYTGALDYKPREDGEIRILYSCSDSHLADLKWIAPVLTWLGQKYPNVRLISQGNLNFTYLYPNYTGKASHELYAPYPIYHQKLREISPHICLGPLLPSDYANSRSNIKFLQTASVKAAFIGSDLPPYQDTVKHGVNGLLASNRLQWWWQLRKLIRNPEYRRQLGNVAYLHASQHLLKDHVYKWYDLYKAFI